MENTTGKPQVDVTAKNGKPQADVDVQIQNEGSLFLFHAETQRGKE